MSHSAFDRLIQCMRGADAAHNATDGELLRAFTASDDQAAFAALTKRHGPLVLAVCRRILGNLEEAEDAFQATFIVLARQAATIVKKESLASWLHGVAQRVALNARRLSLRRHKYETQAKIMVSQNPAAEASWRDIQVVLDEEIQCLPEKYREPFILCCLEKPQQRHGCPPHGFERRHRPQPVG